jgi:hypothetical protein
MRPRPFLATNQSRAAPTREPPADPIEQYGDAITGAYQQKGAHRAQTQPGNRQWLQTIVVVPVDNDHVGRR